MALLDTPETKAVKVVNDEPSPTKILAENYITYLILSTADQMNSHNYESAH